MKKIFIPTTIVFAVFTMVMFFCNANTLEASDVRLKPSKESVGIGEQFYVDVLLDPQGHSYNGAEGSILFSSDSVSFVRAEEGKSIITTWIQKPTQSADTITFAGIMASGFQGVIDPFNSKIKLPGPIVRLVFEGKKQGTATFTISSVNVALNDGLGTIETVPQRFTSITVDATENLFIFKNENNTAPTIEAYVTSDQNLYDNKYVLVFQAKDKGTGIKYVLIQEGNREWKEIESPYLLEDQTRRSILNIQAVNYSGASIVTTIEALPYEMPLSSKLILLSAFVFVLFIIARRIYVHVTSKTQL